MDKTKGEGGGGGGRWVWLGWGENADNCNWITIKIIFFKWYDFIVKNLRTQYKKSKVNKTSPQFSVSLNSHISHFNINLFLVVSPHEKITHSHVIIKHSGLGTNDWSGQVLTRSCAQWVWVSYVLLHGFLRRPCPSPIPHLISVPPSDYDRQYPPNKFQSGVHYYSMPGTLPDILWSGGLHIIFLNYYLALTTASVE